MDETPPGRRWWQRLPVIVAVAAPTALGMYFLAFVAAALLLTDQTRESETRAGGLVLLIWWAYSFREGDTSPYVSSVALALGAALLVRGAVRRRREGRELVWVPVAGAVAAMALAVVAFVPDGYRAPSVTRDDALRRTLTERTAKPWRGISADSYLVERGRARFVHTPLWYVVLYEHNPSVEKTVQEERCFTRREVWKVDGLDGDVSRVTYDEAFVADDPCLPVRVGTKDDLKPVPR